MGIGRRDFLKFAGMALAGIVVDPLHANRCMNSSGFPSLKFMRYLLCVSALSVVVFLSSLCVHVLPCIMSRRSFSGSVLAAQGVFA
jgi:hypothetical protein